MIGAVFDCVVFLQAAANPNGPAGACLALVETGQAELFVSTPIIDEVRDVFARPATRKKFSKLNDESIERFLLKVTTLATLVQDVPAVATIPRDHKDEPYLDLAIVTQVLFLVTRDRDLLDLMKDGEFQQTYPWLTILEPPALISRIRADSAKGVGQE